MPDESPTQPHIDHVYDRISARAEAVFADGRVVTDPYLLDRTADTRIGLSVVARPVGAVRDRLGDLAVELHELEPDQHRYANGELHVTVINLLPVVEPGENTADLIAAFARLTRKAVTACAPFAIRFSGILLASDCVIARGYPVGPGLEELRNRLRSEFRAAGLGHLIEREYKHVTAHSTVFRFRYQLKDLPQFRARVAALADIDLGRCEVATIRLVEHDWYHTSSRMTVVGEFDLVQPG
jgi:2'-5' RNA ligase